MKETKEEIRSLFLKKMGDPTGTYKNPCYKCKNLKKCIAENFENKFCKERLHFIERVTLGFSWLLILGIKTNRYEAKITKILSITVTDIDIIYNFKDRSISDVTGKKVRLPSVS